MKEKKAKKAKKTKIGLPEKETRRGKKRKFIATVMERFSDTFEVWAEGTAAPSTSILTSAIKETYGRTERT